MKVNFHMRAGLFYIVLITGYFLSAFLPALADDGIVRPFDEYKIKAAFLYNFTKFVAWPGQQSLTQTHIANVCILGDNPFGNRLEMLKNASSALLAFNIKEDISDEAATSCQILFISKSHPGSLSSLFERLRDHPVLTVSDMDGFAARGGMIEMKKSENNIGKESIKLLINRGVAESNHLIVDAQLLNIAIQVIN